MSDENQLADVQPDLENEADYQAFLVAHKERTIRINAAVDVLVEDMRKSLDDVTASFHRAKAFRDATIFQRLDFVIRRQLTELRQAAHQLADAARKKPDDVNFDDDVLFDRRVGKTIACIQTILFVIRAIPPLPGDTEPKIDEWDDILADMKRSIG